MMKRFQRWNRLGRIFKVSISYPLKQSPFWHVAALLFWMCLVVSCSTLDSIDLSLANDELYKL